MTRTLRTPLALALTLAVGGVGLAGCSTAPKTEAKRQNLKDDAQTTLSRLTADYPNLQTLIDQGAGYVIFPSVGKGGLVLAGSYGRGTVYENGRMIGYADITGGSFGRPSAGRSTPSSSSSRPPTRWRGCAPATSTSAARRRP